LIEGALDDGPIDVLVLTSGSTARGVLALADDAGRERLLQTPVVVIGEPTAEAAHRLGFATVLVAPASAAPALASFIAAALGVKPAPSITGGSR
jgi:uroporphyrinogen-III synthase